MYIYDTLTHIYMSHGIYIIKLDETVHACDPHTQACRLQSN